MAAARKKEAPAPTPALRDEGSRPLDEIVPAAESEGDGTPPLAEDELIVLAVRGMALFPGVVLPIAVGREKSIHAIQAAVRGEKQVGILLQRDHEQEHPAASDLYEVGTAAEILRYVRAPDDSHHVIAQGRQRFRVLEFTRTEPYFVARVERIPETSTQGTELAPELAAHLITLKSQAHEALELLPQKPEDLDAAIQNATDPAVLTDMIATFMDIPPEEKQELLETLDLEARMRRVAEQLAHAIQVLRLSSEIHERTRGTMEQAQREYYLREQLKQIQTELDEGSSVEHRELEEAIDAAGMPEEALAEAKKELVRLERMPEASAEYGMVRTYLDWMVALPWSKTTEDRLDLEAARKILDADHHGLEKVKQRILEFLAVRKLKPDSKGPILCLVGPPGVGKTSLGSSIARTLGREFVRVSLGGVHDESEIRGHRRTYVGAMPGRVVQGLRKAGTANPVFLLDEMDKLSTGFHGDPSAALLEVLDPEQNDTFQDHYLGVAFDLSRVLFLATANVLDQVPAPLRDRLEVIELPGYTLEEKLSIARRYLVKKQRAANGLRAKQLKFTAAALREIASAYTREAGCRQLEREIGSVARRVATRIASGEAESVTIDASDVAEILGPPKFEDEARLRTSVAGVATGLAWTPAGGDLLFIEATSMPGKGELLLTGQLGDVMKESARAALSLVRGDPEATGIDAGWFDGRDLHVHVPAGAIPKDGPSAGVALYTALVSLATGRKVRSDVAMTGEVSLRGLVLPVGGIKEKVLSAQRAGIRTVLLPARNQKDLEDVPEKARKKLRFVFLETVGDALEAALEKAPRR